MKTITAEKISLGKMPKTVRLLDRMRLETKEGEEEKYELTPKEEITFDTIQVDPFKIKGKNEYGRTVSFSDPSQEFLVL